MKLIGGDSSRSLGKALAIVDLILRLVAFVGALGSAIAMGTTNQTYLVVSQYYVRFRAEYDDLPSFTFFVVANGVVAAYLLLVALPIAIVHIIKKQETKKTRIILTALDTAMLTLLTAGAAAATSMVYLAHKGNPRTNWQAICPNFNSFCERISGSLIGSYIAMLMLIIIIILSALAISHHHH
ncbi:unnamed protein product [Rhodiola kirilowii]